MPTLKVFVNEAADLFGADLDGKSDPYCVLKIGEGNQFSAIEKTSRVKNTKNPMWKECFTLNVNNPLTESLFLEVWNQEKTKDDSLGYAQIPLHDLQRNVEKQIWIQLEGGSTGGNIIGAIASHLHKKKGEKINHGKVFLGLTALDFGIDPSIAQQQFGMQQGIGQGMQQQHGIGMQQQHLMGQGIGMQQPMMQQGMMHNQPGFQQGINQPMMPTCTQCPTTTPLMMQQPGFQHTPCTHTNFNQGLNTQPGMMHTQPGMMNQGIHTQPGMMHTQPGMINQGPITTHKDLHNEHQFEKQQGIHKGVGEKLHEHKELHNQGTGTTFNHGGVHNQGIHTQPGMINQGLHTNNQPGLVQQPCVTHGINDNCAVQQAGPVMGHKDLHNEHKLEKEQGVHKGLKEKLHEHKELHDVKKADKLEDRAMEKQVKAIQSHEKHTNLGMQNEQGFTQGTGIQNQRGVQQGNFQPGMIQPPSSGGYQGGVAGVSVLPPTHGAVAGNQAVHTPQIPSTTMPINTGLSTHPTNVEHGHHTINQAGIHNQGIQQPLFNQGLQTHGIQHATTGTTTTIPSTTTTMPSTTLNNQFHSTTRPPVLGHAEGLSDIERAEREKHKI